MDTVHDILQTQDVLLLLTDDNIIKLPPIGTEEDDDSECDDYTSCGRVRIPNTIIYTPIGAGAYSTVYKLGDHRLCYKKFKHAYGSVRELCVASMVSGLPGIITYVEYSINGILMKQYETNLSMCLHNPIERRIFKQYMYDILTGVYNLHSRGIMYRDVKPHNIMVESNRAYIADFGISSFYVFNMYTRSLTQKIVNHAYTPVEVIYGRLIRRKMMYTTSIDIAAVGFMFFEILCGIKSCSLLAKLRDIRLTGITRNNYSTVSTAYSLIQLYRGFEYTNSINSVDKLVYELKLVLDNNLYIYPHKNLTALEYDLISRMTCSIPSRRLSCESALNHPFFDDIRESEFKPIVRESILVSIPDFLPYAICDTHKYRYFDMALSIHANMSWSYFSMVYGFYIYRSFIYSNNIFNIDHVVVASLYIASSIVDTYGIDLQSICEHIHVGEIQFKRIVEHILKSLQWNAMRKFPLLILVDTLFRDKTKSVIISILTDFINVCFIDGMGNKSVCKLITKKYNKHSKRAIIPHIKLEPSDILQSIISSAANTISTLNNA